MRVHHRLRHTGMMAVLVGACLAAPGLALAQDGVVHADIGTSGPLPDIASIDAFNSALSRQLVWQVGGSVRPAESLRLNVIRIDRGRVTASRQSRLVVGPEERSRVYEAFGEEGWNAVFPDCCLTTADLPIRIRAYSGRAHLEAERLEQAIAALAETAIVNGIFELRPSVRIDWGRQVVLIVSASSEAPIAVRPLILVLERR